MVDSWKNNLLNLPDAIFFDIMRNYLGDLKTPFNKHDLLRSLTTVISNKDTRARIFKLIDNDDSRLLTAIALLEASDIDELHQFTKQYYSFLELHNRVANLQERLLICIEYPEQNSRKGKKLIKLNPIFKEDLKNGYLDTSSVFSSMSVSSGVSVPWFTEHLITSFLSFTVSNKNIFKQNTISRKKVESAFTEIFNTQVPDGEASPIDFLLNVVSVLGFIKKDDGPVRFNIVKIFEFGNYLSTQRNIMIAAAAVSAYLSEPGSFSSAIQTVASLLGSLSPGTRLHENDLKAYIFLVGRNIRKTNPDFNGLPDDQLIDALSHCGYIVKDGDFRVLNFKRPVESSEKIRIQSNFEFTAPAGCSFSDEITTALSCEIKNFDITRTYEFTKTSFAAALDSGLNADEIKKNLQDASDGAIPQNILFSMTSWNKEYSSISLNYGIVLTVSKERLPFIEHSPGLKNYFTASPSPGVFILDPEKEDEWRKAFADAGFDMLPSLQSSLQPQTGGESIYTVEPPAIRMFSRSFTSGADKLIGEIAVKIGKLSMSAENKLKLEARAQKKLILNDSQLTVSNKPEERGEAGGIDHRAKIRLVERALELDNLLEVTTAKELELEKRLIKPLKLIKADAADPNKPQIFLVDGIELPEETELQIPITRISYLRMLKSSLFTP